MNAKKKLSALKVKAKEYRAERKKINPHRSFRPTSRRKDILKPLVIESWRLFMETHKFLWKHRVFSAKMIVGYAILGFVLIGGLSQMDYSMFKEIALDLLGGNLGALEVAGSLLGAALSGALVPQLGELQQFMTAVLTIMFWLVLVWAFRMLSAKTPFKIRDALYNSQTPLIGTLVVLAVMTVQLVPGAVALFVFNTASNGQWLRGGAEAMLFAVAAFLLCILSLYWLVSSIIALPIVSLPGTYPLKALGSASKLVMGRRWSIVLRVVIVAILLLLVWVIVLFPMFLLDNWLRFEWLPLVPVTIQILGVFSTFWISAYVYKLYRSLL